MRYLVFVYNNHREDARHVNRPLAYANPQGGDYCAHTVYAENLPQAKREAIREHLRPLPCCSQADRNCRICREARELKEKA